LNPLCVTVTFVNVTDGRLVNNGELTVTLAILAIVAAPGVITTGPSVRSRNASPTSSRKLPTLKLNAPLGFAPPKL
jgi:hypothetical protein